MNSMKVAIQTAVTVAGGQAALGAALGGVSQQSVSNWVNRGGRCPAVYCLRVERLTGVTRHELRPDIYGAVESA